MYQLRAVLRLVTESCPTLCDPMDCSQAPLSLEFSRQEYWSGLPSLPSGDLPNPGIKPRSPVLQVDSLPAEPPGKLFFNKDQRVFFFFFFLKKSDIWKCFSKLYWKEMRKHHIQLNEETIFVCDLSHWWHVHTPHWFSIDPSSTGQHASSSTRHHWFCVM